MYPQSWEAQQYLLNELELIQADNLAKRYKDSQTLKTKSKSKKRIVKLSPKKVSKDAKEQKTSGRGDNQIRENQEGSESDLTDRHENSSVAKSLNEKSAKPNMLNNSQQEKNIVIEEMPSTEQSDTITAKEASLEETIKDPEELKASKTTAIQKFPDFHVVEKGDTLYSISVKYNIKIKALRKWNKIYKNKKLHIKDIIFLENPKLVNQ